MHSKYVIEKCLILSCRESGTQKKSESSTKIEPLTSRSPVGRSNHWATGRNVASEVTFTGFVVTPDLYAARISNVQSTICDNKERKVVSFNPGAYKAGGGSPP